jgi:histone acetyltransferase (RNA polymerase elongator complex component)
MKERLVVPFFIPHEGCPFTCVFCNQWEISGAEEKARPGEIRPRVLSYLESGGNRYRQKEVAFFGGSFTGLPVEYQESLLFEAWKLKEEGLISGIRLSTRPDYISREILELLLRYGVTTVELGVQSLASEVLARACRGHSVRDIRKAAGLIREYPLDLVFQLMLGLPGDDRTNAGITALETVRMKADYVRIYPTVVLKGTTLAKWYETGQYRPWTLEETVEVAASWLATFNANNIRVIRMGLQASENLTPGKDLLAGPYHPAFGELVESRLLRRQMESFLRTLPSCPGSLKISFNPRDHSQVIGQKHENMAYLQGILGLKKIDLEPGDGVAENDLLLTIDEKVFKLSREDFLKGYRIRNRD